MSALPHGWLYCNIASSYQAEYCSRISNCSKKAILEALKLTCPDQEKHPPTVNLGGAVLYQYPTLLGARQWQRTPLSSHHCG